MSARERIAARLWMAVPSSDDAEAKARAEEMLDAYRAEVRNEVADDIHRAELPTFAAPENPVLVAKVVRAVDVRLAEHGAEAPYGVAAPDFFRKGRTYEWRGDQFRVLAVDPHPLRGDLTAIGWLVETDGTVLIFRMTALDWESGKWTEVTAP